MEYLIGSLDDDGLLRISLDSIADKLSIYQGLYDGIEEVIELCQGLFLLGIDGTESTLLAMHLKQKALLKACLLYTSQR